MLVGLEPANFASSIWFPLNPEWKSGRHQQSLRHCQEAKFDRTPYHLDLETMYSTVQSVPEMGVIVFEFALQVRKQATAGKKTRISTVIIVRSSCLASVVVVATSKLPYLLVE